MYANFGENPNEEPSIVDELIGHPIEMFGYDDGVIYIKLDNGKFFMLSIQKGALYIEAYDHEIQ